MWNAVVIVVCAVGIACGGKAPAGGAPQPVTNRSASAVVRSTGVFVDDKLVVPPDQLRSRDAIRSAIVTGKVRSIVLDIDSAPAAVGTAVLAALYDLKLHMRRRSADGQERAFPVNTTQIAGDEDWVKLSIEVLPTRVVVGLARVDEFQHIQHTAPQQLHVERLRTALELHKPTAFFYERNDIEIAAADGVESRALLDVAELATQVGFTAVEVVSPDALSARAGETIDIDLAGLRKGVEVIAKLRERAGSGAAIHVGEQVICARVDVVEEAPQSTQHVTLVRRKRPVWIAFGFVGREHFNRQEVAVDAVQATVERNLKNPFVATLPMVLAAEQKVDAATVVAVLRGICAAGVSNVAARAASELPLKP